MKQENEVTHLLRDVRPIVVGVLVAYAALVALYFLAFGSRGCCDQEAWGQFGDFIGGSVNPILGLVSVLLLALTLREQRRLLKETREQALVDELQRLVSQVGQQLDDLLMSPVRKDSPISDVWSRTVQKIFEERGYGHDEPSLRDALSAMWGSWTMPLVAGFSLRLARHVRYDPQFLRLTNQVTLYDDALSLFLSKGGPPEIAYLHAKRWGPGVLGIVHVLMSIGDERAARDLKERFARYGLLEHVEYALKWLSDERAAPWADGDEVIAQSQATQQANN